nr:hypothetical protein [Clostridioides difficile]
MEEIEKLIHTLEENMKSEFEIKFEEISKILNMYIRDYLVEVVEN